MLAHRYHADLCVYADAAQFLVKAIGANFSDAFQRADRARIVFERAREELIRHIGWHDCWDGTDAIPVIARLK